MRGIVLQPVTPTAGAALAQQLACWAKTATGLTDVGVRYGTCCVSPTGETLGRWTIPPGLCDTYGELPFTSRGEPIVCDSTATQLTPYYIYDTDVTPVDPNECDGEAPTPLPTPTGLSANPTSETTINITWEPVDAATGYAVTIWPTADPSQADTVTVAAPPTEISGLDPQTAYTIQIVALDDSGTHLPSSPAQTTATTPAPAQLPAPPGLAADAVTDTGADLSWDAVPNAEEYLVSWALASAPGTPITSATVTDTTYTITGLDPQTDYIVSVVAQASGYTDSDASTLPFTTDQDSADPPTDLTAGATTTNSAALSWTASPQADGYTVSWALASDPGTVLGTDTTTDTTYTVTGLSAATDYLISVVATDSTGTYADSDPASLPMTTATPPQLAAPTLQQVAVSDADTSTISVTVDYGTGTAPQGAAFTLEPGGHNASVTYPEDSAEFTDLDQDLEYTYTVTALGDGQDTSDSAPLTGSFTYGGVQAAPVNVEATAVSPTSVIMDWDLATGVDQYSAQVEIGEAGGEVASGLAPVTPPHQFDELEAATVYVPSAYSLGQPTSTSTAGPTLTADSAPTYGSAVTTPLEAPANIAASDVTDDGATVSWEAVAGAESYAVSWALTTDPGTPVGTDTTAAPSYDIAGLDAETGYTVTVVASATGIPDSASGTAQFTTGATPQLPTPAGLAATGITAEGATATWDAVTGADGYAVSWALAADPGAPVGTDTTAAPSYDIAGLDAATDYIVTVVATDSTGSATDSEAATAPFTTAAPPVLPTPSGLDTGTPTTTGATVTWGAVTGADGYIVSWALSTDPGTPVGTESVTDTSHAIADLEPGTEYIVSVVATDSTGGATDSEAGTVSFTTAVPPALAAPTLDNVTITDAGAGLVTITVDTDTDPNGTQYTLDPGGQSTTEPSGTDNAVFGGVTAGTTYTYTVTALGDGTANLDSVPLTGTFTYAGELPDPASVTADPVLETSATISWDAVAGAISYTLDVSGDDGSGGDATIEGAASPQEVSPLLAQTAYTASVVAVGTLSSSSVAGPVLGTDSLGEATAQFTTGAPEEAEVLAAPTGLAVSAVTALGATVSWEPVDGAEEYTVSWALALTPEVQLGSDTTTEPSYGLLGLLASTLYVVTITAHAAGKVDSSGASVEVETALAL